MNTTMRSTFTLLALCAPAAAQSFDYPNFSGATGLALNDAATIIGSSLRLTPVTPQSKGSVWYDQKVQVESGFDTTFQFRMTTTGADGMAFVIHDDPAGLAAIGSPGGPLAYAGFADVPADSLDHGLAIEFDCWANTATSGADQMDDPNDNHISIHTGGAGDCEAKEEFSLGQYIPTFDLNNGLVHTARIQYAPPMLHVYLNDLTTPVLSVTYNLSTGGTYMNGSPADGLGLIGGEAYVGFTGATGGVTQNHDVLSWSWGQPSGITVTCDPANDHFQGNYVKLDTSSFGSGVGSDLHIEATDGPDGEFGFLLLSPDGSIQLNVFNGILCLGAPQGRYNPLAATNQGFPQLNSLGQFDATGVLQNLAGTAVSSGGTGFDVPLELPFSPAGQVIAPGDTYFFQCWYRDQVVMPGDSANFSNVIQVTFP